MILFLLIAVANVSSASCNELFFNPDNSFNGKAIVEKIEPLDCLCRKEGSTRQFGEDDAALEKKEIVIPESAGCIVYYRLVNAGKFSGGESHKSYITSADNKKLCRLREKQQFKISLQKGCRDAPRAPVECSRIKSYQDCTQNLEQERNIYTLFAP